MSLFFRYWKQRQALMTFQIPKAYGGTGVKMDSKFPVLVKSNYWETSENSLSPIMQLKRNK